MISCVNNVKIFFSTQNPPLGNETQTLHHENGEQLTNAVEHGCPLCAQVLDTIKRYFQKLPSSLEGHEGVPLRIGQLSYYVSVQSQFQTTSELIFWANDLNELWVRDDKLGQGAFY